MKVKTPAYAIVRIDQFLEGVPIENQITIKEIVFDSNFADSEVERLNKLNGAKQVKYFSTPTRIITND